MTPPDGVRPVLVLWARVPEHAQALSLAAVGLAVSWLTRAVPLPTSVLGWLGGRPAALVWAVVLGASGVAVLVAAWAPARMLGALTRITVEQAGHFAQASACLLWAAAGLTLGARGAVSVVAFGAWAVAGVVRAVRAGRAVRTIGRAVRDG